MSMHWPDERYVRLYTRDTPDWLCLSFPAQGLFCLILRKVNRAGVLPLGRHGRKGVFLAVGHQHQAAMLEPALDELLADGCVSIEGDQLAIPNFVVAQECDASDRARAKKHREKVRDRGLGKSVTQSDDEPEPVTQESRPVPERHAPLELRDGGVTGRDGGVTGENTNVTPYRAVPCSTVPSRTGTENPQVIPMPARRAGEGTKLGPLSTELRARVEKGLRHGLAPCSQQDADELEDLLCRMPLVEAVGFIASTCRKRDTDPQSVAWLVTVLRSSYGT